MLLENLTLFQNLILLFENRHLAVLEGYSPQEKHNSFPTVHFLRNNKRHQIYPKLALFRHAMKELHIFSAWSPCEKIS